MIEPEIDFSVPTMDEEPSADSLSSDPVITITVGDDPAVSGILSQVEALSSRPDSKSASPAAPASSSASAAAAISSALSSRGASPQAALATMLATSSVAKMTEDVVQTFRKDGLKNIRPWGEFFSSTKMALPAPREVLVRVPSNLRYFQANYLFVFLSLALYSVITSPSLLFVAIAMGCLAVYLLYWRKDPIVVFGHSFADQHRIIVVLAMSLVLCIFTSAASTLLWIGSLAFVSISLHSALWTPAQEDLFLTP